MARRNGKLATYTTIFSIDRIEGGMSLLSVSSFLCHLRQIGLQKLRFSLCILASKMFSMGCSEGRDYYFDTEKYIHKKCYYTLYEEKIKTPSIGTFK